MSAKVTQSHLDKVAHAKLYYIRTSGPNAFVVSDKTETQHKVIVGPQRCTCDREQCVHLLFVMLRVLKLDKSDARILAQRLKDYEVESLIRAWQSRKNSEKRSRAAASSTALATSSSAHPQVPEEETCPICLGELGRERLLHCRLGCGNSVHLECMRIWATESRRQHEKVLCPQCRTQWQPEDQLLEGAPSEEHAAVADDSRRRKSLSTTPAPSLIQSEKLTVEMMARDAQLVELFGLRIVECLRSKRWEARQGALLNLEWRLRTGDLLVDENKNINAQASRRFNVSSSDTVPAPFSEPSLEQDCAKLSLTSQVSLTSTTSTASSVPSSNIGSEPVIRTAEEILRLCCAILTSSISDPCRPVFVAVVNAIRSLFLHYIPSENALVTEGVNILAAVRPLVTKLVARCSDPNSATALIATEACLDIATCSQLENAGTHLAVTCLLDFQSKPVELYRQSKRWWLGRLRTCYELMDHSPRAFTRVEPITRANEHNILLRILDFIEPALGHAHVTVRRTSMELAVKTYELCGPYPSLASSVLRRVTRLQSPPAVREVILERVTALSKDRLKFAAERADDDAASALGGVPTSCKGAHCDDEDCKCHIKAMFADEPSLWDSLPEPLPASMFASKSLLAKLGGATNDLNMVEGPGIEECNSRQWCILDSLGNGAFAACFASLHIESNTTAALKRMPLNKANCNADGITNEISILSQLSHPNIVRMFGHSLDKNYLNLFLELCSGGSVSMALARHGPFPVERIRDYAAQLCNGVAYLHYSLVLHGDLKGANLLLDADEKTLKVADFGASVVLKNAVTLTNEFHETRGTPAFIAPEVIRGESYGRKADVWSIGCCVLEMLVAVPPWNEIGATNTFSLMFHIATNPLGPAIPSTCDPAVRSFLSTCFAQTPAARPASADLLQHEFLLA